MNFRAVLVIVFLIFSSISLATEHVTEHSSKVEVVDLCHSQLSIPVPYDFNEKSYTLSESVQLEITQYLSKNVIYGEKMAANIQCQTLKGTKYTGSDEEWKNYFNHMNGVLSQKGGKNLQLTVIGTDFKAYNGKMPNREFKFTGNFNGAKQIIHNLAVLDIKSGILYSVSVSGAVKIENYILKTFKTFAQQLGDSTQLTK